MSEALEQFEKGILEQLKKLESFRKALEDALTAVQRLQKEYKHFPDLNASALLNRIVTDALVHTSEDHIVKKPNEDAVLSRNDEVVMSSSQSSTNISSVENKPNEKKFQSTDIDQKDDLLVQHLLRVAGPKKGVKYKVEVKSPLNANGNFWACHVESGFIHSKLEPLSDRLKLATQSDKSLWKVDNLSDMVCSKSVENGLWMRGMVVKELNDHMIRLRFIDIGRTEDCPKSRLSKVPAILEAIPFMAFNCCLLQSNAKLEYEAKWRFNDLTSKKILDFTVERIDHINGMPYLYGQLETILDDPKINITDEIKKFIKRGGKSDIQETTLVSRDVRANQSYNPENLSSGLKVIRDDTNGERELEEKSTIDHMVSVQDELQGSTDMHQNETEQRELEKLQEKGVSFHRVPDEKKIMNICVGDSLPPLKIPSHTLQKSNVDWGESLTPGPEDKELELPPLDDKLFDLTLCNAEQPNVPAPSTYNQNPRETPGTSALRTSALSEPGLNKVAQLSLLSLEDIESQLVAFLQYERELLQNQQFCQSSQIAEVQQQIKLLQTRWERLHQLHSISPADTPYNTSFGAQFQDSHCNRAVSPPSQQHYVPRASPSAKSPIESNLPVSQQTTVQQPTNCFSMFFNEEMKRSNEHSLKVQQLNAIRRSLTMPSELLDAQQMAQLHQAKHRLEKELFEEEHCKRQMDIRMQHATGKITQQTQQHHREAYDSNCRPLSNFSIPASDNNGSSKSYGEKYAAGYHGNLSKETELLQEVETLNAALPKATPKFEVPFYDSLFTENYSQWVARELFNLTHPELEHPKARFYSVVHCENKPGFFVPQLDKCYRNGFFRFWDADAAIFQKQWEAIDSPIFLIILHKSLVVPTKPWRRGGIIQVTGRITEVPVNLKTSHNSFQCRSKFVSTAIIDSSNIQVRLEKHTREIFAGNARQLIKAIIAAVKEKSAINLFHYVKKMKKLTPPATRFDSEQKSDHLYDNLSLEKNAAVEKQTKGDVSDDLENNVNRQLSINTDDLGSGDECERDLDAELEAFGLKDDDCWM